MCLASPAVLLQGWSVQQRHIPVLVYSVVLCACYLALSLGDYLL